MNLRACLVKDEIGRIENRWEKSGEKTSFMSVKLERRWGWKIGEIQVFSPLAYQNSISLIWGKNRRKRNSCINDWTTPSFFCFPGHGACWLLFQFFFFLERGPAGCFLSGMILTGVKFIWFRNFFRNQSF